MNNKMTILICEMGLNDELKKYSDGSKLYKIQRKSSKILYQVKRRSDKYAQS